MRFFMHPVGIWTWSILFYTIVGFALAGCSDAFRSEVASARKPLSQLYPEYISLPRPRSDWQPGLVFETRDGMLLVTESATSGMFSSEAVERSRGASPGEALVFQESSTAQLIGMLEEHYALDAEARAMITSGSHLQVGVETGPLAVESIPLNALRTAAASLEDDPRLKSRFATTQFVVVEVVRTDKLTYTVSTGETSTAEWLASVRKKIIDAGAKAEAVRIRGATLSITFDQEYTIGYKAVELSFVSTLRDQRLIVSDRLSADNEVALRSAHTLE